jgi:hypothetical protein
MVLGVGQNGQAHLLAVRQAARLSRLLASLGEDLDWHRMPRLWTPWTFPEMEPVRVNDLGHDSVSRTSKIIVIGPLWQVGVLLPGKPRKPKTIERLTRLVAFLQRVGCDVGEPPTRSTRPRWCGYSRAFDTTELHRSTSSVMCAPFPPARGDQSFPLPIPR